MKTKLKDIKSDIAELQVELSDQTKEHNKYHGEFWVKYNNNPDRHERNIYDEVAQSVGYTNFDEFRERMEHSMQNIYRLRHRIASLQLMVISFELETLPRSQKRSFEKFMLWGDYMKLESILKPA